MPYAQWIPILVTACAMTVSSAGCSAGLSRPSPAPDFALASVAAKAQPLTAPGFVNKFSALVQQNGPAVVNISSIPKEQIANAQSLWPPAASEHDPFPQFFRQFSRHPLPDTSTPPRNVGSGFIIRPDGYILTDARLVADATEVEVKLTDRCEFKASVVGVDRPSGIALLKIDANGLPTVTIGKPSDMKSGQWVVAIGAPYGFKNSATAGIVSNTARLLPQETYIPLIQTDMTATTGDEGAPLFNLNGETIGITLIARPPEGAFEGISFAIPIDAAMRIEQQLLLHGRAEHGHLGVTIQDVTWPLAQSFGLKKPVGALISSLDRNGPAARSGLRSGDIILQLNGTDINDSSQLPVAVADLRPGTSAHLQYWRDHGLHETVVVLGAMRDTMLASIGSGAATPGRLGLTVRRLTPDEKHRAEVSSGVRVEQSAGPAAVAGILPGDIVLQVNHEPVSDPAQFRQRISGARNMIALLVLRDGQQMFVPLDLG
ncbi:trypsin-like peptidase domain-containing protein [Paraburkholderia fynbosensis]|uniref:Probable periplasmic serine endoprotease DegP-like n=1 Tax=Paraburkholderia fynbosensis TaxID=1200993 RepID=A0A6J5G8P8_9BURK|nr:trypsin-like peptidase domain-containing protein [Paraburkholderia fynbosensis]CAB3795920.1 Periplasmic pH-dependent serine endoprotease DegQ [Paraburkholderia fynbosensis]